MQPRSLLRPLALALGALLVFAAARQEGALPLVDLAGPGAAGEFRFELRERRGTEPGARIAARLTFVPEAGASSALFRNVQAAPHEFAARANVVYSRSGYGRIRVPAGRYTVYASRGPEWSLASRPVEILPGTAQEWRAELVHELETPGWISADFHLHTRTYSGHGDANLEERVLSFLGEGLELAVATDHNHHTDYRPTMRALGVEQAFAALTGNEVSTPIGHFNAFPLDPARAPVDASLRDANALFRLLRAEPNAAGVVPVIQLNHPRLDGIDYFTRTGLDPVVGTSTDPAYSGDFDALEVLNDNLAQGYHDPVADRRDTGGHTHSVLRDWFHLLNLGQRPAAVGNSDSHDVAATLAGYPRNYVRSSSDEPARIDPAELAAAVRAKQLFTTTGPFLEVAVEGVPMGGEARARAGHARLALRVRAASWVSCERLQVFLNGELYRTLAVPATGVPLRLEQELELCLLGACARHGRTQAAAGPFDAWVVVVAEGDGSLAPVLAAAARPLAIANPVWIEADGDGTWTSPDARIGAALRAQPTPERAARWFEGLQPEEQAIALAHVPRGPFAAALLEPGFASAARPVRLAAARAAERCVAAAALPGMQRAWGENQDDPYYAALLLRAILGARPELGADLLAAYLERFGAPQVRRYAGEILARLGGGDVPRWQVLGPLPQETGPLPAGAPDARAPADLPATRAGRAPVWQEHAPEAGGFVRLTGLDGEDTRRSLAYAQVFLRAEHARKLACAFGSDDGSRVWLGQRLVYEDRAAKGANPFEALLTLELEPGWNRLVLEIENQSGDFGFYFRLLEDGVESTSTPP